MTSRKQLGYNTRGNSSGSDSACTICADFIPLMFTPHHIIVPKMEISSCTADQVCVIVHPSKLDTHILALN